MPKAVLVTPLAISACRNAVNGSSRAATLSMAPPAPVCSLDGMGRRSAAIAVTPACGQMDKSGNDLSATCGKDGHGRATVVHAPSFGGATFDNVIMGDMGDLTDAVVAVSTGVNGLYPSDMRLEWTRKPRPALSSPSLALMEGAPRNACRGTIRVARHVPRTRASRAVKPARPSPRRPVFTQQQGSSMFHHRAWRHVFTR